MMSLLRFRYYSLSDSFCYVFFFFCSNSSWIADISILWPRLSILSISNGKMFKLSLHFCHAQQPIGFAVKALVEALMLSSTFIQTGGLFRARERRKNAIEAFPHWQRVLSLLQTLALVKGTGSDTLHCGMCQ